METIAENISATYHTQHQTLRIYLNRKRICQRRVKDYPDLEYWNSLTIKDKIYDINLHRYSGDLSLQIYPVIDNEAIYDNFKTIPLTIIK